MDNKLKVGYFLSLEVIKVVFFVCLFKYIKMSHLSIYSFLELPQIELNEWQFKDFETSFFFTWSIQLIRN